MKKLLFSFIFLIPFLSSAQNASPLKWQFGGAFGSHTPLYMRSTPSDGRSSTIPDPAFGLGCYMLLNLKGKKALNFSIMYGQQSAWASVFTPGLEGLYERESLRFGHSLEATVNYRRSFWRNFFVQSGMGLLYLTDNGPKRRVQFDINPDAISYWSLTPRIDHSLAPIVLLGVGKSFIFYGKEKAKHQFDFLIQARAGLRHMGEIPFTYTDERGTFHHNQQIYGHALTLRMAYLLGIKKRDKE